MVTNPLYSFPARMESLPAMLRHARQAAGAVPQDVVLRMETAIEELLTNSVVHGHAETVADSLVWIGVSARGGSLALSYEDSLAPFDPAGKIRESLRRSANPLEQRAPGGLGLLMVYQLADEFRYALKDGRNRMDLTFQVRPVLS